MKSAVLFIILLSFPAGYFGQKLPGLGDFEYFGQKPPSGSAEIFAPGIVSNGITNRDITFTPDGKEIYWGISLNGGIFSTIVYSKFENNKWTSPQVVPYFTNPDYSYLEPHISPDGKKLFFYSNMPDSANGKFEAGNDDIWVMDRIGNGWGKPYNLGAPVNSPQSEFYPTVTSSGTLYFCRKEANSPAHYIYRSKLVEGKYSTPEKMPDEINSGLNMFNSFIAPDESYIIIPTMGRRDTRGFCDYYISFKKPDGSWTKAINMGDKVNSPSSGEWSASLSPDGIYLFFTSPKFAEKFLKNNYQFKLSEIMEMLYSTGNGQSDIYWVKSDFIEDLKKNELTGKTN